MQRINYFTNPNFTGPFADINSYGGANAAYNANTKQLNIYGNDGGYGFNLTVPKNAALVFACFLWTKHDKNPHPLTVYSLESSGNNPIAFATVSQDVNNLLLRFNSTGTGRIRVEFYPRGNYVNIDKPILELADTYDKAVGGASGLLHRGHDATQLTQAGRVVQDEDNQHGQKSGSQHHRITQRGSEHSMRSVDGRQQLSCQHIRQRQRRHSLIGFANYRQINEGQLATGAGCNSDQVSSRFRRAIRQADRHRDGYAHLHVGRVSGEQDSARQHQIFHRGHDAARLTLLGVMA